MKTITKKSALTGLRNITLAALLGLGFAQVAFVPEAQAVPYRDRGGYYYDHGPRGRVVYNGYYRERPRYYRGRPVYVERYRERVYAPPPVVYAPPEPSGLSLVFPLHFN